MPKVIGMDGEKGDEQKKIANNFFLVRRSVFDDKSHGVRVCVWVSLMIKLSVEKKMFGNDRKHCILFGSI